MSVALNWNTQNNDPKIISLYLAEVKAHLDQMLESRQSSRNIIAWRTKAIDHLLIELFNRSNASLIKGNHHDEPYAIFAQGGYGREELCYHSDIDLLFLHNMASSSELKARVKEVRYPLWDSGLDIGFAVRPEKECLHLMKDDLTILTSLIDARFLAGDHKSYEKFHKNFWNRFN